ncbi:MAG: thiamine kinase-like enzyme [Candidatus Azotimanducaceae bacterium]|jgi:thiamine kinase-like enzyme
MTDFPKTVDELSSDWLNAVLPFSDHAITSFEATIIGVGEGFMGQLARVKLTYSSLADNAPAKGAPRAIIAKFASTLTKTRMMAKEQNYYAKEIGFYNDIGDDVGVRVPACFHTSHNTETNHFVILLEDLAPAIASDQVEGTSIEGSKQVMEAFATIHAKWWNSERLASYDWAQPWVNAKPIKESLEILNYSIKQADETGRFDRYPEINKLKYLLPPLCRMEPPPPFPYTLNHGDLRSDNVFLPGPDGGEFAMIDWQLTGMAQPMTDIARWLTQSITVEQRRETEHDLLKLYHERLVEYGVEDYSYKQMMQEYQLNLVVLLFMFTMTMDDIDQTPERAEAFFHALYSRLDAALVDWKVVNLLKVLPYLAPFLKLSTWLKMKFQKSPR